MMVARKDRIRIERTARVLRYFWNDAVIGVPKQFVKAYAALLLLERLPGNSSPELKCLVQQILLDVKPNYKENMQGRQSVGRPEDSLPSDGKITAALFSVTEAAYAEINVVGQRSFGPAVEFEAASAPDPTKRKPSLASVAAVAKHSGAARSTVRRWRQKKTLLRSGLQSPRTIR
jgi:hypothetical protein